MPRVHLSQLKRLVAKKLAADQRRMEAEELGSILLRRCRSTEIIPPIFRNPKEEEQDANA